MRRVLIVEDDSKIAFLERDYLEAHGYETVVEENGLSGLRKALGEDFSLVLLDIMLPDMEGYEVCREIRKEKNVPIIFVTAKNDEIDKIRGLGLGADDFITKPFSPTELVARVSAHINRYERLVASVEDKEKDDKHDVIEVGSLFIDIQARRVYLSGKEVNLANKEFDLLLFLAQHPNVVYSKDTLFDKIWGEEAIGETSTVTVHINRIREKIEKDMSEPEFIETVWGAGYRFRR
ncbi:MAG: response regulator transcription factor [Clostridia bacterium]|nr:response regulator transcription factor [Clostridia bacterium]